MGTEAGWDAWIAKGSVLWHWSVQRNWKVERWPTVRGDHLHGIALTENGARKKARKWLANRIEWSTPKLVRREYVTLQIPATGDVDG